MKATLNGTVLAEASDCQYFNVRNGEGVKADLAWSYPSPIPSAFERVGHDFTDYVAFARDVDVS